MLAIASVSAAFKKYEQIAENKEAKALPANLSEKLLLKTFIASQPTYGTAIPSIPLQPKILPANQKV
jgi:hypothetical protein